MEIKNNNKENEIISYQGEVREEDFSIEGFEFLPEEVRVELNNLPEDIKEKVLGKKEEINKPERKTMGFFEVIDINELANILKEDEKQERILRGIYTKKEISLMNPEEMYLATKMSLYYFIRNINFNRSGINIKEEILRVLDNLWQNRSLDNGIEVYDINLFDEAKRDYDKMMQEKEELLGQIKELEAKVSLKAKPRKNKKGNDPYNRLQKLKMEYRQIYGEEIFESSLSVKIRKLGEVVSGGKERELLQEVLQEELKYYSAEDIALMFADELQSDIGVSESKIRFSISRWGAENEIIKNKKIRAKEVEEVIMSWIEKHSLEQPIKKARKPKNSEMSKRLIGNLQDLIKSYYKTYRDYTPSKLESAKNFMLASIATLRKFC